MTPRAFIFDLDGTLVDNMAIHIESFSRFMVRHGLPALGSDDRSKYDGKRNRDIFPALMGRELSAAEQREFAEEKEAEYRTLSAGRLRALPGLDRLLQVLFEHGIGVGLATSAPRLNVEHTLRELGLPQLQPFTARSDEVPRGKPFPDVFIEAARLVGVPPGDCLAFEDAALGILAAQAAGMRTIGITTTFSREQFATHGAVPDEAVADYDEFLARCAAEYLPDTVRKALAPS